MQPERCITNTGVALKATNPPPPGPRRATGFLDHATGSQPFDHRPGSRPQGGRLLAADHQRHPLLLGPVPLLLDAIRLHLGLDLHPAVELHLGDAPVAVRVGFGSQRVEDRAEICQPLFVPIKDIGGQ